MTNISLRVYSLLLSLIFLMPGLYAFGQDCSKLAKVHRSSVVSLSVKKIKKETGVVTRVSGTGFIVSPEGCVLTAYHVIAGDPDTDEVQVEGSIGSLFAPKSPLDIIAKDESRDIALLAFKDRSQTYELITLGNSFDVHEGVQLCSLSFSTHLNEDFHINTGVLSARSGQDDTAGVTNLWTTQMPSNAGESGAPVLDLSNGEVVAIKYGGVVRIKNPDPNKPDEPVQHVNYLIPINMAKTILEGRCEEPQPEPTLESVQVTFLTKDNGKDSDTGLAMSIKKGGTTIASNDDIAHNKHFEHGKSYGPFSLNVQPHVTKAIYKNSSIAIRITPKGHDRWITSVIIEAKFSDDQVIQRVFGPLIVDQDTREANFQIP